MRYIFPILLTALISCKQGDNQIIYSIYKNKPTNNISIGEKFRLIFGSNSCCPNGQLDKSTLRCLEYVKDSIVLPAPDDSDGCTTYFAIMFKAIKLGTDTVRFVFHGDPFDNSVNKKTTIFVKDSFLVTVSP